MAFWTWLTTSCESGWRRHARFLAISWLAAVAVCVLMARLGEGLYFYTDFRENGRRFGGLMTLASGFCLVACGWSLMVPARRALRTPGHGREAAGWLLAAVGSIVLAFDEVAQLHESAAHWLARHHVPGPFGLDQDLYVFGAYAAGLVLVLVLLWPFRRPLEPALLPLLVAITCFAMSEVVDEIPWDAMSHATQQWVGALEEIYKVLGSWTIAMCGLLTADEDTRGIGSGAEPLPVALNRRAGDRVPELKVVRRDR